MAPDIVVTEFVDKDLEPESVYYYVVRACNSLGCSEPSDGVASGVTESDAAVNAPESPLFIEAQEKEVWGPNFDEITWTGVRGATYYEIFRAGAFLARVSAPKTRHTYGDLVRSLGFSFSQSSSLYHVRAYNKAGCSPFTKGAYPYLSLGRGSSIPAAMVGVCEVGLKLTLGEGCQLEDNDIIVYVNAQSKDICVGTRTTARCPGWVAEINEELIVTESESGKEWLVLRHPLSRTPVTQAEVRDSGAVRKNETERASFTSIDAGYEHTCGVKTDGSVACWGNDADGETTPPAGQFSSVSAGDGHTCGIKTDGSVACCGNDADGQASSPEGSFLSVSAGNTHTCGVKTDGSAACWGSDERGEATPP